MIIKSIITGDIVDSTRLSFKERDAMLKVLEALPDMISPIEKVNVEIFRGDSFQIGVISPSKSLKVALAIRAFLRSHQMWEASMLLDARLAIGIGPIEYNSDTLSTSDGEAFRLSGKLLDKMDRRRLEILTIWDDVNEELSLNTAFADDIVSSWTQSQSRIEFAGYAFSSNRNDIAKSLGISRQMIDKSMKASKEGLINNFISRFEKLITEKINNYAGVY